jgi:hypothetical protein
MYALFSLLSIVALASAQVIQGPTGLGRPDPRGAGGVASMDPMKTASVRDDFMTIRNAAITGKVLIDGVGSAPVETAIETVCQGVARFEGYVQSDGEFLVQIGQNSRTSSDASYNTISGGSQVGGADPTIGQDATQRMTTRETMDCFLRATLPGFDSSTISLAGRNFEGKTNVGTIMLKRRENVEGISISATAATAPKKARQEYEKGLEDIRRNKHKNAMKHFQRAVKEYPQHAMAWFYIGRVHEVNKDMDEAVAAYRKSIETDMKLTSPLLA